MLLGIVGDLTSTVTLDADLIGQPTSGLYYNSGVHPTVTVDNLLQFLSNVDITFTDYSVGVTYGKYSDTRLVSDLTIDVGVIYESRTTANIGNTPATSPDNWLETNIKSLRLKIFIQQVEDRALGDIALTRRQIDSQNLYDLVEQNSNIAARLLPNDFAAWVFEPKGSDYTVITLNQVAFQATTAAPQNLYVINQGVLITTLTLNPNIDGRLVFEDINYSFFGKGQWIFAVDSQDVLTQGGAIDSLKYDGFVAYMASGIGATPEGATYSFGNSGNGLAFNVSVHLDPTQYLANNLVNFAPYLRATFELEAMNLFLNNPHIKSNRNEREIMKESLLLAEAKDLTNNTVARNHNTEKTRVIAQLDKTFDRQINGNDLMVTVTSV